MNAVTVVWYFPIFESVIYFTLIVHYYVFQKRGFMSNKNQQVYISYAWGGESERIANELDSDLQANDITIIRDKRDLGYKGSIRRVSQNSGR